MKASQALIKAYGKVKQTRGEYRTIDYNDNVKAYCAFGLLAYKKKMFVAFDKHCGACPTLDDIMRAWKIRRMASVHCPACTDIDDMSSVIVHLNDDHKWNFKQIGQWIRSLGY